MHGVEAKAEIVEVVERVKDAEDVDAGALGLGHKRVDNVVGVGRVPDGVHAAQQHLSIEKGGRVWCVCAPCVCACEGASPMQREGGIGENLAWQRMIEARAR